MVFLKCMNVGMTRAWRKLLLVGDSSTLPYSAGDGHKKPEF